MALSTTIAILYLLITSWLVNRVEVNNLEIYEQCFTIFSYSPNHTQYYVGCEHFMTQGCARM